MKSIKARFEEQKKKNPGHGDYICLVNAVRGQNFTKNMIGRWFTKLVPKDEYAKKDKKSLIDQLVAHSKCAEDNSFEGVKAPVDRAMNKNDGKLAGAAPPRSEEKLVYSSGK